VRKGNICQISRKTAFVTGTQQAVDHAGRDDEMAYQEMLKGLELKRDIERVLIGLNQKKVTGDTTTARKTGAVLSWLKTNTSKGATGAIRALRTAARPAPTARPARSPKRCSRPFSSRRGTTAASRTPSW
jgi:hypothetical protein